MSYFKLLHEETSYLSELKRMYVKEETDPEDIEVENPGILEVPEGKDVEDLPESHFQSLIKKKGWEEISRALINLVRWNKNKNKSLSNWADSMQNKLSKWVDSKRDKNEDFGD